MASENTLYQEDYTVILGQFLQLNLFHFGIVRLVEVGRSSSRMRMRGQRRVREAVGIAIGDHDRSGLIG